MIVLAFALMLAGQPAPESDAVAEETPVATPAAHDEEEICRRLTVPSPKSAGGKKTTKVCKTKEEWRDFAQRRS